MGSWGFGGPLPAQMGGDDARLVVDQDARAVGEPIHAIDPDRELETRMARRLPAVLQLFHFERLALPFDVQPFAQHACHALALPLPPARTRIANTAYFCERAPHPIIQQPRLCVR